jgi:phosphonoacetaldehyde hydrolase
VPADTDIALVVFDWAGTTIDFGCVAPVGAFAAAFAQRGVTVSFATARRPMGMHKKDHVRAMLETPEIAEKWREVHNRDWTQGDVDDLYRLVTPLQVAAAGAHADLCPHVVGCVAELRLHGIKIGATTGYFREAAEVCYTAGERQGYVPDAKVCADDVSAGRPAPWMIYRVMELTNVYPPTRVVKVGDTRIDIEDGINAGVWSVGVIDSSNEMGLSLAEFAKLPRDEMEQRREVVREQFIAAGADGVIDTLADLPDLIAELNAVLAAGEE